MSTVELADRRCVSLRRASAADEQAVAHLLAQQALPRDGVADWLGHFWVAEHGGALVGVAGIELYGSSALLRSVAVDSAWRGTGLGRLLTDRALAEAEAAGAADVYLLTTTAEHYFPRVGFACIARDEVPEALTASEEFRGACPASAVAMHRALGAASEAGR
jgi:amino-acid N-acetyltransferase